MGAFDKIKDALFGGNDIHVKPGKPEWSIRVRPYIKFSSPISRTEFEAKWVGGERSCAKKIGSFSFPKIDGTVEQDLKMDSDQYPLTFFFDGPKHDLTAKSFWKKSKEPGRWKVWHPVHGLLYLQLHSISQKDAPVENSNITEFSSEWSDPINPETLMTGTERMGDPDSLDGLAAEEFSSSISTKTGALGALKNAVKACQKAMDKVFGPIMAANGLAQSAMLTFSSTIDSLLISASMNVLSLAGSIQQTIALPAKIGMDKKALLDSYNRLAEEIFDGYKTDVIIGRAINPGAYNVAKVKSLYAAAIMSGAARGVLSAGAVDRANVAVQFLSLYGYLIEKAEDDQTKFQLAKVFQDTFFAFEQTYSQARGLGITVARTLNVQASQSPVTATFRNNVPTSPFMIAASEYGPNEDAYDAFVEQNDLKGIDILLLEMNRTYQVSTGV